MTKSRYLETISIAALLLDCLIRMNRLNTVQTSTHIIQLLVFEEPNIEIYRCVKGDIDRREAEVNITFHTPINLDIGLFKHQLLFNYFSMSSVWLILSKCHVFLSNFANQFIYLSMCLFVYLFFLFIYLFYLYVKFFI